MRKITRAKPSILGIIRDVGIPTPPKLKLIGLLESPEQDLYSFSCTTNTALFKILEYFAESSINIRFISKNAVVNNRTWIQICTDPDSERLIQTIVRKRDIKSSIEKFTHQHGVKILSLYPFKGDPWVVKCLFDSLLSRKIEILATNTASSVISCVIRKQDLPLAIRHLHSAFTFS